MSEPSIQVTTWYLEQTTPQDLSPAREPAVDSGVRVVRAEVPCPEFSRFLYTAVGGSWSWTDRLDWTRERWQRWLEQDGVETWVAYARGTPAGYAELTAQTEGAVEISYFGLLPSFTGRGLGGHLLSVAAARAWDLKRRWPDREVTRRVWVHTCSLDGEGALPNYRSRGFRPYRTRVATEPVRVTPNPWPRAR